MDNDRGDGYSPRPKVQGNWACAECGTAITELPFQPKDGQQVYCSNCYRDKRPARGGGGGQRRPSGPMIQGQWQCSGCGNTITELPFEPSEGRPVYCRDCYRNNRPSRGSRNF